jgi:hypothetical protein
MPGASLLSAEDEPRGRVATAHAPIELDMQRDHGPAGVTEEILDPEVGQDIEEDSGTGSAFLHHEAKDQSSGSDKPLIIPFRCAKGRASFDRRA